MTSSVTIEAGSWMRVVNTNVTKTAPAATMARMISAAKTLIQVAFSPASAQQREDARADRRPDPDERGLAHRQVLLLRLTGQRRFGYFGLAHLRCPFLPAG